VAYGRAACHWPLQLSLTTLANRKPWFDGNLQELEESQLAAQLKVKFSGYQPPKQLSLQEDRKIIREA